jgi:VWFA-related protein
MHKLGGNVLARTLCLLCVSAVSFSFPLQERPTTFRVRSNLVVVDVTVRDKSGKLVPDLKREDFRIFENSRQEEIVTFSLEDIPSEPAPPEPARPELANSAGSTPAAAPLSINLASLPRAERRNQVLADKRLMVLFFDLSSLSEEDLTRSVTTAQAYVSQKSSPSDLIAIATYSSTLQIVQDLTNDRTLLNDRLKQLNPMASDTTSADAQSNDDSAASDEVFVPDDVQFNLFNTDRRLAALTALSREYGEYPERKSLIYFSGTVQTTGSENQSQLRATIDAANQANMTIYTVDAAGLQALPPGGSASQRSGGARGMLSGSAMTGQFDALSASQETLTTIAHDTGGTSFQDSNDLAPVFTKVVNDTRTYYVIGYYSSNTVEDGKFRKIRVEVTRPDLKITHRPGYFASKQFTKLTQAERDRQLEEALELDRPFSDVPFILQAASFRESARATRVPVSLQVAGDGIRFEEKNDRREAHFEFLARVLESTGRIAAVARDTVQVDLPAQKAQKIQSGQILYNTGFQLRPGEYKLKFIVRDNSSGRLGSFEQGLSVPLLDGKTLQTSSIVLGNRLLPAGQDVKGVEHEGPMGRFEGPPEEKDPLVIEGRRLVPNMGNIFAGGQTLYTYFQVYGAGDDPQTKKPSLEASLLFLENKTRLRESQPLHIQEWTKGSPGTATVAISLPLHGLKKGSYTLQVHLRDNVTDTNIYRRVPVIVN